MTTDSELISIDVAYRAMLLFWTEITERTGNRDIGAQLGECLLLADGCSADPARQNDFLINVRQILANPEPYEIFLHIR